MNALNQDQWGRDPATGISAHDALRLAVRKWIWLLGLPLAIAAVVSVIYTNLPTRASATAVLNVNADLFDLYAKPILNDLPASTSVSTATDNGAVVISVETTDAETALTVLNRMVDATPEPEIPLTSLSETQALELRALRQYRQDIQQWLGDENLDPTKTSILNVEATAAKVRIAYLEARDVPPTAIPKVAQKPTAAAFRRPALVNVVVFSFLATLFVTWGTIYQIERRRIVREKGML